MTTSPTFGRIKAQVSEIQAKSSRPPRVIGLRSLERWTGDREYRDGDRLYVIQQCDSPLAIRAALQEELEPGATKVLVTSLESPLLGADILARLAKQRLIQLDPWRIVMSLFQARAIDPRLAKHSWIAERLMSRNSSEGYPAAVGGFLDAEAVWPILLRQALGLGTDRPDLVSILRWSTDPSAPDRYRAESAEFKEEAGRWLSDVAGPTALAVLQAVESNDKPDALPIGLAMGVVYHHEAAGKLDRAAGRLEERHLGGTPPGDRTIERWTAAATEAIRLQITDPRAKRTILDRADEILKGVGAEGFAHLSATSPLGFDQRLAEFGRRLAEIVKNGRFESTETLRKAREEIANHALAARERDRLERLDMATRLVRWLRDQDDHEAKGPESFPEAVQLHLQEMSFVDWARLALRRGDPVHGLSEAYARLFGLVSSIREKRSRSFAKLLAAWTAEDHQSDSIIPVERLIDAVVAPLAAHRPVLLIVVDGMSAAVCRELLADMVGHDWLVLSRAERPGLLSAGLAAIPSITEASRTSLFRGTLARGTADNEREGFLNHPALKSILRSKDSLILRHKSALRGDDDAILAGAVRDEIADPRHRVVGVVVNAVDDTLSSSEQLNQFWNRESIPALGAMLHEAKSAGRIVVLASDHGHVIDVNGRSAAHDEGEERGGARWRLDSSDPTDEEVRLSGRRVVMPDSQSLIAPWTENLRYGTKRRGYHGGANPQEMIAPIVVLSPVEMEIEGWTEAPADHPLWWEETFAGSAPPPPEPPAKAPKKRTEQALPLFEPAEDPDETAAPAPKWVAKLLDSTIYEQQKKLAGRAMPPDEVLGSLLAALDSRGGKLTSPALSKAMAYPPQRLRGLIANAQRVLNVDGFAVLIRDEASDTVEMDRELLLLQFEVK